MSELASRPAGEAVQVRAGEDLDWDRLARYLRAHAGLAGEMSVLQFPNGSANLTYLLRFPDQDVVFRRPPFGALAPGAHDMRREFSVLSKLWQVFSRAPRALLFCDDKSVVGSDFLISEFRVGEIIWSQLPESMAGIPGAARQIGYAMADALADLHLVDYDAIGLSGLGRPDGFVRRQVEGWASRWQRVATADAEEVMAAVAAELARQLPAPGRASIVHNDFKIDNCQFAAGDPARVTAVFDWDMATLGDPLIDLGTLMNYWPDPSDRPDDRALSYVGLDKLGLPSRAQIAARYAERTGMTVSGLRWYEAFAAWKTAIVREQLHNRHLRGETSDPRMALLHENVEMLGRRALRMLREG